MSDYRDLSSAGGIDFCIILFGVFLVLKLSKVINWSWWWVTAPLWIPLSMLIVGVIAIFVYTALWVRRRE